MSRAQWLAFGSVALVGCVGTTSTGGGSTAQVDGGNPPAQDSGVSPQPEAGTPWDTGVAQEASLLEDSGTVLGDTGTVWGDDSSTVTGDSGTVATDDAGLSCPSRSGYFACNGNVCDRSIQACSQGSCLWYGDIEQYWGGTADAASCGSCPTCACLQGAIPANCTCNEDSAGTIAISCGGCYGSPPARLERLVA